MQVKWYFPLLQSLKFWNRYSSPTESGSVSSSNSSIMKMYFLGAESLAKDYNLSLTTFSKIVELGLGHPYDKFRISEVGLRVPFLSKISRGLSILIYTKYCHLNIKIT